MFFSRSKEEPSQAKSPSTASTSASAGATRPPAAAAAPVGEAPSEAEWQTKGAAGLGAISSMSAECTPLKHRYDACFNLWFKDYLAIGDDQIQEQQRQSAGASSGAAITLVSSSNFGKRKSGWFSDSASPSSPSSSASTSSTSIPDNDIEERKRSIMERYERDCGKLFKDYQACVKRAVTDRGLDDLISQARKENPFPFDHQRQTDPRPDNPPFPFPAAKE